MYEYISFDVLKVFAAQDGFSLARKALIEASCYEDGEGTPVARIYVLYIYIYISRVVTLHTGHAGCSSLDRMGRIRSLQCLQNN